MRTINTTIEIHATPAEVWAVLTDFPSHKDWNPFFARIEGQPVEGDQLKIVARTQNKDGTTGEGMSFSPTVLEVVANKMLRWQGKLFVRGIFDGEHFFELIDLGDGRTKLNHGENFGGILIPLMGKVLKETEEGFTKFNRALADEVAARQR